MKPTLTLIVLLLVIAGKVFGQESKDFYPYNMAVHPDSLSEYDGSYHQFEAYLSQDPLLRPSFFYQIITAPQNIILQVTSNEQDTVTTLDFLSHKVAFDMINDIDVLSDYHSDNYYSSMQWPGEIFSWKSDKRFKDDVSKWEKRIKENDYLKKSKFRLIEPDSISSNYLEYISSYLKNKPHNRIQYFHKYRHEIPMGVLKLIKIDLDSIFKIETPNFLLVDQLDEELYRKAKEIWETKISLK